MTYEVIVTSEWAYWEPADHAVSDTVPLGVRVPPLAHQSSAVGRGTATGRTRTSLCAGARSSSLSRSLWRDCRANGIHRRVAQRQSVPFTRGGSGFQNSPRLPLDESLTAVRENASPGQLREEGGQRCAPFVSTRAAHGQEKNEALQHAYSLTYGPRDDGCAARLRCADGHGVDGRGCDSRACHQFTRR